MKTTKNKKIFPKMIIMTQKIRTIPKYKMIPKI